METILMLNFNAEFKDNLVKACVILFIMIKN